jgi:peroxiredoxin
VLATLLAATTIGAAARAEEPPAGQPTSSMLHLEDGGYVAGALADSDRPGVLRWQPSSFVDPLDFPAGKLNAIHFSAPAELARPGGAYCFELAGGDVLFGNLVGLDDRGAVLDVPRVGRLHVRRSSLRWLDRWRDGADLVYLGPNGLTEWRATSTRGSWREESGQLLTQQHGASLGGDLGIPARAIVEFEISWERTPDFVLALGVEDDAASIRYAFRFEVWDRELVVLREAQNEEADVAALEAVAPGAGRLSLRAYLDQEKGRMLVFSPDGKRLADLQVGGPKRRVLAGIHLANVHGDLRLERLRIARWDGEPPRESQSGGLHLQRTDGSIVDGQTTRFDTDSKQFVVLGKTGETRVAEDQTARIVVSPPSDGPPRAIRAVNHDGSRMSGELTKVEDGEVWLAVPGFEETARLPVAGIRSLVVLRQDLFPLATEALTGVLVMDGVKLGGALVEARAEAGSSCLAWRPRGSTTAGRLRPGISGRIVYREPPPRPPPRPTQVPQRVFGMAPMNGNLALGNVVVVRPPTRPGIPPVRQAVVPRSLHLRSGDIIPSEVTKIDGDGVWFRTPLSDSKFVPHDKVQAAELAPELTSTVRLNKSKRERLLTLPRMQKESPPTHLIRSRNGDYLRGRVLGMDDKTLRVEVRLEAKDVPRERISRIIWLHPEELDPSRKAAGSSEKEAATRVQAVRSDGTRLTFFAERLADATLSGKSDVLGACRVWLGEVDQLLIGGAIEQEAAHLAYQQWKLHNAQEPKEADDDESGSPAGRPPGTGSALVGKPAPDFQLDLLEGKTFRLSESKGQVVVLDFWATWCGPCLQAMPQVDRVTREFRDRGVRLVAVNLQEAPKQIASMLERHKLSLTVALDRDGAVAEKYAANAIPQTVIVDRDGTIVRLFVGGGPRLGDQLRDALRTLLPGEEPKGAVKK